MERFVVRLIGAAALGAALAACSPGSDDGKVAKGKQKAEWPVPPSLDQAANQAEADNAAASNAADADNASEAAESAGGSAGSASGPSGPADAEKTEVKGGAQAGGKTADRVRSPERPATYRAVGTEPFWSATIADDKLTLEMPDMLPRRYGVTGTRRSGTMRWQGDGVVMSATPGTCSDGMSDDAWSDQVQIAMADRVLKGCGGIRWRGSQP